MKWFYQTGLWALLVLFVQCSSNQNQTVIYQKAPIFPSGYNQDGAFITPGQMKGMKVVQFFFTSCPSVCPNMQKVLRPIYTQYEHHNAVLFLSYTIDPEHDTVARLKQYAVQIDRNVPAHHFINAPYDSVQLFSEQLLASYPQPVFGPHTTVITLVDSLNQVIGYYETAQADDIQKLELDLQKWAPQRQP